MAVGGRLQRLLEVWLLQHLQALVGALGRLWRTPVAAAMTAGVIGISLALPAGFMLLLGNLERSLGGWEGGVRISVFLEQGTGAESYRRVHESLRGLELVEEARLITPEQARAEFEQLSGFSEALALLEENPLPPVVELKPVAGAQARQLDGLLQRLEARPEVASARMDREWLQRLQAMMALAERGVQVVALLLALAVLLVVGNTIRLAIENRRDEIIIQKLIGASNGFVRRPFLYEGLWYGLLGSLLAWLLVQLGRWALAGPAERLAGLYQRGISLQGLDFSQSLLLLLAGVLLGLLGSWIAVGRHLSAIEPH
ncbi:permease-like cell division protein FtsX [Alkalilimnicola sp. S0819]|uniref:permease-like cell division protein FtsX n=1 Tax=Alkalilimnicola sp. S0819 TaxID=2613922 RepID=UPI0012618E5D|nr:permease-like cell division protein FtsX [Alkalilimnicola sp. S0819]KAB7627366.1 ABC transporter permease [Alkalilimnicola sp. S0819]MPQ16084.1 FtsX-like permease family protein [Alkalilimnicola sp. S0819]